jgi:hypothetical protein
VGDLGDERQIYVDAVYSSVVGVRNLRGRWSSLFLQASWPWIQFNHHLSLRKLTINNSMKLMQIMTITIILPVSLGFGLGIRFLSIQKSMCRSSPTAPCSHHYHVPIPIFSYPSSTPLAARTSPSTPSATLNLTPELPYSALRA